MVNYYISQMILFPFYDINLDLGKGELQRCRLGHLSCMEAVSAIKDTQFQLRWFLLFALGCDCVARSFCAALPTPPGQYLLQTLQSSHLPPFVREVQLFFFGKLRGVFNTQPHSLVWFDFSLLCILFLINPVVQNEISVRTWEWPGLKISLFLLSFLLFNDPNSSGHLGRCDCGSPDVFFFFLSFCFFFFFCMSEIRRALPVPLIVQSNIEWSSPRNTQLLPVVQPTRI